MLFVFDWDICGRIPRSLLLLNSKVDFIHTLYCAFHFLFILYFIALLPSLCINLNTNHFIFEVMVNKETVEKQSVLASSLFFKSLFKISFVSFGMLLGKLV